jgi:NADPH:quinone reductase-like Zn-dependent oxidoreductase
VFITAYDALVVQGGLASGGTALVHAGASGVGTAAIQLANMVGATVIVTASESKVARCRELGAHHVVDYNAEDFVAVVNDVTEGGGVDVVLDVIGGEYVARNVACLRTQGRIVQVGVMGGGNAEVPIGALMPKRASITGTVLRARPLEEKIAITQRVAAEVVPRFDDGSLVPVIDSRFPIDDIAAAHDHMASNANVGKILIEMPRPHH